MLDAADPLDRRSRRGPGRRHRAQSRSTKSRLSIVDALVHRTAVMLALRPRSTSGPATSIIVSPEFPDQEMPRVR
jgi:hypothetical protein